MPSSDLFSADVRDFHTTHWSIVLRAGGDSNEAQTALARLCEIYWFPLYTFVRREGHDVHDAQDLTQEFFARLLAKGWIGGVEREKGRFRSWLLASVKHFLANEWDRVRAEKRGGRVKVISIDEATAEERYRHQPAGHENADDAFDRQWALSLLGRVLKRIEAEFINAGKADLFVVIKGTLSGDRTPYTTLGERLKMSEGAVKVAVHRLRDRYRQLIRAEIQETVADAGEIEDELRHLLTVLSK